MLAIELDDSELMQFVFALLVAKFQSEKSYDLMPNRLTNRLLKSVFDHDCKDKLVCAALERYRSAQIDRQNGVMWQLLLDMLRVRFHGQNPIEFPVDLLEEVQEWVYPYRIEHDVIIELWGDFGRSLANISDS